jgi:hypothetical protein
VYRLVLKRWSAVLLLVFAAAAFAAPAEEWEAAQRAFQDGDHASALLFFETARDTGLDGPAVHYNIAVSQFELGRYENAGQTFALIAHRFPQMRGLAEYNLGLVARRLGDVTEARAHFLRAYELSPDDRTIRVLASRRLRELEPDVRTASRWTAAAGVRAGNDDNVALRDEAGLPSGTTVESPMTDVFVSIQGPWNGRSGFRLDGSAYLIKYFDADEFDQSELRGGVFYEWRPDEWRIQIGPHASAGTLGGDAFDRKAGGSARLVRYVGRSAAIDLRYTYDDVSDTGSLFAGIAGSRQQFDARYRWYADGRRLQLRYLLETNDRADPGVSPHRNRFAVDYRYQLEAGWGYEAGVDFRNSDYADLATPREENLLTLRGTLTYAFTGNWIALFEYRNSDNDSTDESFSYDRAQITLGATKSF